MQQCVLTPVRVVWKTEKRRKKMGGEIDSLHFKFGKLMTLLTFVINLTVFYFFVFRKKQILICCHCILEEL
jgi:hypothetical protein